MEYYHVTVFCLERIKMPLLSISYHPSTLSIKRSYFFKQLMIKKKRKKIDPCDQVEVSLCHVRMRKRNI